MLLAIFLVFLILVAIALAGVVLLQRSEGGALGMGGGPSGFLTTRGAGDLLTRTTWILGSLLFALCLGLTIAQGRLHKGSGSVVDRVRMDPLSADQPVAPRPVAPAQPAAGQPTGFDAPAPQVHTGAAPAPGAQQLPPGTGSGPADPFAAPGAQAPAQKSAPAPTKP